MRNAETGSAHQCWRIERVALDAPANELSIEILVEAAIPILHAISCDIRIFLNMKWVSRDFAAGFVETRKAGVPLLSAC
jgi:hypothetical protein